MKEQVGVERLDHVCWAVWKLEDALPLLTDLIGMRLVGQWRNEEQGYAGVALEVPGSNAGFELLAPISQDGFLARFLRQRGPGLHHVTFQVKDVDRADQAIRAFGIEPWGGERGHGWAETYIHPRDSGGVLFQFFEEDEEHHHEPPK